MEEVAKLTRLVISSLLFWLFVAVLLLGVFFLFSRDILFVRFKSMKRSIAEIESVN
jgi:hypothetical protein